MASGAGTLTWFNSIYGVNPLHLPPINAYDVDIRAIPAADLSASS